MPLEMGALDRLALSGLLRAARRSRLHARSATSHGVTSARHRLLSRDAGGPGATLFVAQGLPLADARSGIYGSPRAGELVARPPGPQVSVLGPGRWGRRQTVRRALRVEPGAAGFSARCAALLSQGAGRRLRKTLLAAWAPHGVTHAVAIGFCNAYCSYLTTPEEYAEQAYEGASNLYGQHSLPVSCSQLRLLAQEVSAGRGQATLGEPPPPFDLDWAGSR